jgi:hypothetical protein
MTQKFQCRMLHEDVDAGYCKTCKFMPTCYEYKTNVGETPVSEEIQAPATEVTIKPKRKRRTPAQMAAARAAEEKAKESTTKAADKKYKEILVAAPDLVAPIEAGFAEVQEETAKPVALVLVEEPVGAGSFVDCSGASVADLVCYKAEGRKVITTLQWYVM